MSDYPEWQATAREAYQTQQDVINQYKLIEEDKRNTWHDKILKDVLSVLGIEGEPIDGKFIRDGYTLYLSGNAKETYLSVDFEGVVCPTRFWWIWLGYTSSLIDPVPTPLEPSREELQIQLGKILTEIDEEREKRAKTDVHVVAAEPAVRVMSPLEERLLDSLRVFVVNAVSEIDEYDEDRPY